MELYRALGALVERGEESARLARLLELPPPPGAEEYTELFELNLWPRAAVYVGPEGMLGGEAADRIAGFWSAAGLEPPTDSDHLTALLGAYAMLAERESESHGPRAILAREARKAMLWEHLLPWVPAYLEAVRRLGGAHFRAWARLLRRALIEDAAALGAPARLPLHLREAPALPDPRAEGGDAFLDGLLAPARTGLIVTRADLARAARARGLGFRQAERRYVLRAMLGQDPRTTLRWLRDEARWWSKRHAALPESVEPVRRHWIERSERTASLAASLVKEPTPLRD